MANNIFRLRCYKRLLKEASPGNVLDYCRKLRREQDICPGTRIGSISRKHFVTDLNVVKRLNFDCPSLSLYDEPIPGRPPEISTKQDQILRHGITGLTHKLGQGGFGLVVKAQYLGQPVALKVIDLRNDPNNIKTLCREQNALGLRHPNIINTLFIKRGPNYGIVVMELTTENSLYKWIMENPRAPLQEKFKMMIEVCLGVEFCHSNNILHLDIKPQNVLLTPDGHCKLGDFGNSISTISFGKMMLFLGTVSYAAPELFNLMEIPSSKADIFSLAITMWTLHTGKKSPYPHLTRKEEVIYQVAKYGLRPQRHMISSPSLRLIAAQTKFQALYQNCWLPDPAKRPDINEVIVRLESLLKNLQLSGVSF